MDQKNFISAIDQICEEKGISREKVLETIEMALAAAYKKEYNRKGQNISVKLDIDSGETKTYQVKLVVDESMLKPEPEEGDNEEAQENEREEEEDENDPERKVRYNPEKHIMIEDVQSISPKDKGLYKGKKITDKVKNKIEPGDEVSFLLDVPSDFGRIAAQTAKQVIIQRVREAEREAIYEEFKEREGEVLSGVIQRIENQKVFFDLGKATGILFPEEQIPQERYRIGQRMRIYLLEIEEGSRGSVIHLSRAHPKMVSQLFKMEVPEISSGTVEIKAIAREPGSRSKIAVISNEEKIDPIGSMIGQKGSRVQTVINELNGEKIDIIEWSDDPAKFIANSLSPAKISEVKVGEKQNQAKVIVPEDQLSLAIGMEGQNVRLAARITGWKIDVITNEGKKPEEVTGEKVKTEEEAGKETKVAKEEDKDKKKKSAKKKSAKKEEDKETNKSQNKKTKKKTKKENNKETEETSKSKTKKTKKKTEE